MVLSWIAMVVFWEATVPSWEAMLSSWAVMVASWHEMAVCMRPYGSTKASRGAELSGKKVLPEAVETGWVLAVCKHVKCGGVGGRGLYLRYRRAVQMMQMRWLELECWLLGLADYHRPHLPC